MPPISRFPVPDITDLPDDLRERILQVQEKSGFVPNVFLAMAHRPDELRAFLAYHDAVMERDSSLTRAEREMVVVATSAASRCTYCVVAHGAILRVRAKDPVLGDLVMTNYRAAPLTDRQRAMLDYAVLLSSAPDQVDAAVQERLRAARVLVVGAGGLGQLLSFHMGLFHMGKTATILGAMLLLVALVVGSAQAHHQRHSQVAKAVPGTPAMRTAASRRPHWPSTLRSM